MFKKILKQYLLIFILGFSISLNADEKKVVETEEVIVKKISESVQLIGTVRAKRSTLLTAKASGFIDYEVEPGKFLKKGQLIAKLENAYLEKNFALAQKRENLEKKQVQRLEKLAKKNVSSANALEAQYNVMLEATRNLNQAKIALEQTFLKAPFDGVVGLYKVYEGAQLMVGDPIVYFYDPNELILEFNIPAPLLPKVNKNTRVKLKNQTVKLLTVQRMLEPVTHMAPASITLDCKDCIVGASKKLELVLSTKPNSIVIPHSAVFLRQGKPHVYGIKDSKVILIPIKLGIREKENVEVTKGLKQGDKIVVTGHHRLYPGLEVTVHNSNLDSGK